MILTTNEGAVFEFLPDGSLHSPAQPGIGVPGGRAVGTRPDGGKPIYLAGWTSLHEFDEETDIQRNTLLSSWFPDTIPAPGIPVSPH